MSQPDEVLVQPLTEEELDQTWKQVEANAHPLKVKLMALLRIYGQLGALDLVDKTGKSKPTILKHLDELVKLGMVVYETIPSPGKYDKRIFKMNHEGWTIRGQHLREHVRAHPDLALVYANYQLAIRKQLKELIDLTVTYQERPDEQLVPLVEAKDGDAIVKLMHDNLGQYSRSYVSEFEMTGKGSTTKDFLKLELFLPIRRVIEQMSKDEWEVNGKLWQHFQ